MKKHSTKQHLKTLHPMDSFGIVSGFTKQIRVSRLEKRHNPMVPFPHKHNFYHIVVITKGTGWHEIDFKRYEVKAGAVFLMAPSQVHSWNLGAETEGVVLEFENLSLFGEEESYSAIYETLHQEINYIALEKSRQQEIISLVLAMVEDYEKEEKNFEILLKLRLNTFLILIHRELSNLTEERPIAGNHFRQKLIALIEKNYRNHHEVSFYAQKMGMTVKNLSARVQRAFGKNVRTLIQDRCILESKRLLAYSDLSISEIGIRVGFEDPNYFTRFFKLKTEKKPGKFREESRIVR